MISTLTEPERRTLAGVASVVDAIGRGTSRCEVALHSLAAAELLASTRRAPSLATPAVAGADEGLVLHDALHRLAALSPSVLGECAVADALQHVLLAYLATR